MDAQALAHLRAEVAKPRWIHVRAVAYLHERHPLPRSEQCPCCGSDLARISRRVEIDEVVIDTQTGRRYVRSQIVDRAGFDKLAARCDESISMPLRLPDWTDEDGYSPLAALRETEARRVVLSGGNRGGKSSFMAVALALCWLQRGGMGAEFALIGPEIKQAHLLKKKLFEGEQTGRWNPPIIDRRLWTRIPEKERQEDQFCYMVDGSRFWLTHSKSAGHLKGRAWVRAAFTEASECPYPEVHTVARARLVDAGGQLWLDSTPGKDQSHWLKTGVVDVALEERARAQRGDTTARTTRLLTFPSDRNPWVCPIEMAAARADAAKRDPQMARREFDGEWCSDFATLFGETFDASYHVDDVPLGRLDKIDLTDITRKASRRFFGGAGHDWVIGCDINLSPTSFVMCKVFGDPDDEHTWGLAVLDELWVWNKGPSGAGRALLEYKDGIYAEAGISIDATAARAGSNAGRAGGRTGTPALELRALGFNCKPCNTSTSTGKHQNPDVQDSTNLVKWLQRQRPRRFMVASHCHRTIRALETQEDRGDGRPPKVGGSWTDREVNNVVECVRYLSWALFTRQYHRGDRQLITLAQ